MAKRPNLVFIHNDHQAFYQFMEYDVKPMRPNFNRLAAEGICFDNAYCASPLCGPTRRTLLTGLYAHTHGQHHNYTDPPYDHEVYLDTLAENGYDNFYYGKWHAGPGSALDHQCEGVCHTDYGNPYVRPDYEEYCKRKGLPHAEFKIETLFPVKGFNYGKPGVYEDLVVGSEHYRSKDPAYCGEHAVGITVTPKETTESFYLASRACDKLEELAARTDSDKPFSLRVDFWGPHQPYFPTQEYYDMYKDVKWPPYPSWNSGLTGKPKAYHRERNPPIGTDNVINIPNPMDWDFYNELLRHCAAQITMIDAAGGVILDKLRELGLDENTLIIWTTDHGDSLASNGGHFDKGSFMCQEVLRVPMAMKWKGNIKPGQTTDALVSTVNVPVTLLDAAGLRFTKNKVHGKSLLPIAHGERPEWTNSVVCETYGHGYGEEIISRVIVSDGYKYVASVGDENMDELYDLGRDRYELVNHIDDPIYSEILKMLRRKLLAWQKETDDPVKFDWE